MYRNVIKRILDIMLAVIIFIGLWWLLLIIAIAVKIDDPSGPVIFQQDRIGYHTKIFKMYKFRSMRVGAEHTGSGVYSDNKDPRQTRVGRTLRKTSLDELPQIFNILKGEMSFIGPRSPLTYHPWPLEQYTEEQKKIFNVRPGITGWAQINGRKTVEWNERIRMNVWYSENVSFKLDLYIFFMSFYVVLFAKDNENIGKTVGNNKS